jgi:CheY-like chemotaxis protein
MKERLKIMIVDDDAVSLEVAVAIFEDLGHTVLQRSSSLGTMLAVRRDRPDVVLLDVQMPGLSGDSLGMLLVGAKLEHEPIVILHSSTGGAELEALAKSCNAAGYIEKTSDQRAFLRSFDSLVSRVLNERRRSDNASATRTK